MICELFRRLTDTETDGCTELEYQLIKLINGERGSLQSRISTEETFAQLQDLPTAHRATLGFITPQRSEMRRAFFADNKVATRLENHLRNLKFFVSKFKKLTRVPSRRREESKSTCAAMASRHDYYMRLNDHATI